MDRIKRGTPATISNTWTSGATTLDPGTVTIGVTAADGTVIVAPGTATSGSGPAARTFNLTTTHTAKLDLLTVTWSSSTQGVDDTIHEIVGDFLCPLSDLRAIFTNTTAYPDAKLAAIRTEAEQRLEKACSGRAFVPRYRLERQSYNGGWITTKPDLRTVRSLTVDGTVYTADDIANLTVENGIGWVSLNRYGWGCRSSLPITIGYEYGLDYPDADITRAVLLVAQESEGVGSARPGVQSQSADNMSVTYFTSPGDSFADSTLNAIIRDNALSSLG